MSRDSSVTSRSGQSRNFCGQKEPFAILISGGYARVKLNLHRFYTRLKARYFVVNNPDLDGKVTLIIVYSGALRPAKCLTIMLQNM